MDAHQEVSENHWHRDAPESRSRGRDPRAGWVWGSGKFFINSLSTFSVTCLRRGIRLVSLCTAGWLLKSGLVVFLIRHKMTCHHHAGDEEHPHAVNGYFQVVWGSWDLLFSYRSWIVDHRRGTDKQATELETALMLPGLTTGNQKGQSFPRQDGPPQQLSAAGGMGSGPAMPSSKQK